jgi:hypothetical protein
MAVLFDTLKQALRLGAGGLLAQQAVDVSAAIAEASRYRQDLVNKGSIVSRTARAVATFTEHGGSRG